MVTITWSERIKALRAKGMTFAEIGKQVGLSPSGVSDIEHGWSNAPGGDAALRLDALYRDRVASKPSASAS